MSIKGRLVALFGAGLMSTCQPALAGVAVKDGFAFPKDHDVKIIVFRPDVQVGSLRTGGLDEPNAEWTTTARKNLQNAFQSAAESREANLSFLGEPEGENAKVLNDFRSLYQVVSGEAMSHALYFDRLPSKAIPVAKPGDKIKYKFDWTLGPDAAKLKAISGADYAFFVNTHDAYGDTGRKAAQLLMAGLFGVAIAPGIHLGNAGLVDLSTGDIVWLNIDYQMGGDPRDELGAQKRVKELLRGFPKRDGTTVQPKPLTQVPSSTPTPSAK